MNFPGKIFYKKLQKKSAFFYRSSAFIQLSFIIKYGYFTEKLPGSRLFLQRLSKGAVPGKMVNLDYSRVEVAVAARRGGRSCGCPPLVLHNKAGAARSARSCGVNLDELFSLTFMKNGKKIRFVEKYFNWQITEKTEYSVG
jgi:hypothetical protein